MAFQRIDTFREPETGHSLLRITLVDTDGIPTGEPVRYEVMIHVNIPIAPGQMGQVQRQHVIEAEDLAEAFRQIPGLIQKSKEDVEAEMRKAALSSPMPRGVNPGRLFGPNGGRP